MVPYGCLGNVNLSYILLQCTLVLKEQWEKRMKLTELNLNELPKGRSIIIIIIILQAALIHTLPTLLIQLVNNNVLTQQH